MEPKKAKIIAAVLVIALIALLIIFRVYLRLSSAFFFILGADLAGIFAVFIWVVIQHRADCKRQLLERQLVSEGQELQIEYSFLRKVAGLPTKFGYKELEAATDNFQALLGKGASASVFKGILDDGTPVAVKRIEGAEHGEKEFRAEVAAIASVQHVNLAHLLGYCSVPRGPRLLVYEFVHNGSLDTWIFPQKGSHNSREEHSPSFSCLPWNFRYGVAIDVAKALAYLHHDCRSRILHLDVKPENILLDESFRAVVSDFGLSKLIGRDVSRVYSTVRGTRGYLAPEWLLHSGVSEKSDIYSYGMVLLEIVGGRRNMHLIGDGDNSQRKWSYFPRFVADKLKEGKVMEALDERLVEGGGIDEDEVRLVVHIALWCIQEDPRLRPSMNQVVDMLEGRVAVEDPPETEMIMVDLLSIDVPPGRPIEQPTQQKDSYLCSTYSYSMSVLSGR